MWFHERDPISIHTLAHAAYEIIHVVSKTRNPERNELLFDSTIIKDEYRSDFVKRLKFDANFFKHARADPNGEIDYQPELGEVFLLGAVAGLTACDETLTAEEMAFMLWTGIQNPHLLAHPTLKLLSNGAPGSTTATSSTMGTPRPMPGWPKISTAKPPVKGGRP